MTHKRKTIANAKATEDEGFDGYGSPAYQKWIEENEEWLDQQVNADSPADQAATEIMRILLGEEK